ncbi:MAG: 6-phosphofructokinase [Nitrososphaeria archaeon]|nr:6-phosphofructokinase [Nitrososphaeria archaeon]
MRIGILTGGGDCAGLNAVIRAVVKLSEEYGWEVLGIRYGWRGLMDNDMVKLSFKDVANIHKIGGTILKTSRTNPFKHSGGPEKILENVKRLGLDAIIAVGGDDTLGVAAKLFKMGLNVVGVPKTMDNDISATDYTFGFDSAVNEAMHALDNLMTTGESHDRVMVAEVMGRHAGWVAAYAGIASGAHLTLVPEEPFDLDEVITFIKRRHERGERSTLIVVAEGAVMKNVSSTFVKEGKVDEFGHVKLGGIGQFLAEEIEKRTGYEVRSVVLGHTIRGGPPTAFDRVLSSRFGLAAVELVKEKKFGFMVALRGTSITYVSLDDAVSKMKSLDRETYNALKALSY